MRRRDGRRRAGGSEPPAEFARPSPSRPTNADQLASSAHELAKDRAAEQLGGKRRPNRSETLRLSPRCCDGSAWKLESSWELTRTRHPHADNQKPHPIRRLRRRLRRRRRHGGHGADAGRCERGDARGGPVLGRQPRHRHVQVAVPDAATRCRHAGAALRRVRRGARRLVARRRALHDRSRQPVRLVPIADARRPHQSLGPHLAALRAGRLPPQEHRRPRRRLADHLRRRQAVLRQDRPVHRDLRRQPPGLPERARRHLPAAAGAALLRAADPAGAEEAERPERAVAAVDPDPAAQRPRRLPLLQPVRPRLFDALELLVAVGADPAGAQDRPAEDHLQRDGARGDGRHGGPGRRRHLRRQSLVSRQSRPRPDRRRGRRARASRRASSSTRSRRSSRRGSATRAATSAST